MIAGGKKRGLLYLRKGRLPRWLAASLALVAVAAPAAAITARDLAVVINEADPLSQQVGAYYAQRRSIPPQNVVRVRFSTGAVLSQTEFARLHREVEQKLPASIQGLALAWTTPFRVECMSVTSAFAYGSDDRDCARTCRLTATLPYFNSDTRAPYTDFRIRPAMLLAATDFANARALIERGIASDGTHPTGTAYLMDTSDIRRNARKPSFTSALVLKNPRFDIRIIHSDVLSDRRDVLFYFTGLSQVESIASNRYLPGALADHLTSGGGVLPQGGQMSSLRWLEAGATGSYGTVVEPCAITSKFPSVPIVIRHYIAGETLLEAYWKSVLMPAQGVFIGEPLAAPFAPDMRHSP